MSGHDNIDYAALTDVGLRRSHNQDAYAVLPASDAEQYRQRGHVFLVADGMGAHAVGELASKMAVDSIPHIYSKHAQEGAAAALRRAFVEANQTIHNRGQQNREFEGMGTTGTALLLRPEGAWLAHVGDSRCYRVRDSKIEQLTFDHSLVWELARRQRVQPEELSGIPNNVIVRSLGPEPLVQVDLEGPHPIRAGDVFVLCSDGLSGPLSDREIGAVVSVLPPMEACRLLVDLANLHGGPDNITALVVRATDASDSAAAGGDRPSAGAWPRRISWPMLSLLSGIVFATVAIALTYFNFHNGGLMAFLVAAIALVGGVCGLMLEYRKETNAEEPEEQPGTLQVYRSHECAIEQSLVQKVAKANAVLEARLRERGWSADWPAFRKLHDQAQQQVRKGDLPDAFRNYCRALHTLAEALHKQRSKEEVFQPVWDKRRS